MPILGTISPDGRRSVTIWKTEPPKLSASDPTVRLRVLKRFRLRLKSKAPTGAGSYTKGVVLLVGEQTSHPEENKYHAPFCSTKGCSGWLNARLEEAGIPEDQLFWINALDNDGTEIDLGKLSAELEPRWVLALGNVASKQLKKFNVFHDSVPHPQYWKRFKHHEKYPLISILEAEFCGGLSTSGHQESTQQVAHLEHR